MWQTLVKVLSLTVNWQVLQKLSHKCWWFSPHTHTWPFYWQAAPGRTRWPKLSPGEGLPWARIRLISAALSLPAWTGAFVSVKNGLVRDQISVELVVHILSFFNTDQFGHNLSEPFLPYTECSSCDLETYTPLVNERELGEQTSFSCCSQLLSLCSMSFCSLRCQLVICSICYLSYLSCSAKGTQVLKSLASTKM